MKKLLFFVYFGITVVSAETFYPITKIVDAAIKSELKENLYEIKHFSYECNLDPDITEGRNQNCMAINGEIELKKDTYEGCIEALTGSSRELCNRQAGSAIRFKEGLEKIITPYMERYLNLRYRNLWADTHPDYKKYNLYADLKPIYDIRVFLNSKGGSVDEALEIGKMIRKYQLGTVVAQGDECLSSCFILFMSGITRSISSNYFQDFGSVSKYDVSKEYVPIGVHRMYYESKAFSEISAEEANVIYRKKQNEIELYLRNVGTPDYLINKMKNTSSDDMYILTRSETLNAMGNSELNIADLYNDNVFMDRLKGSEMEYGDFIFQEQFKAIYPDYINSISSLYKLYDSILKKAYGEDYWRKPLEISEPDLSGITEDDCYALSFDPLYVLDVCNKYLKEN